jgi:hypothetical protein
MLGLQIMLEGVRMHWINLRGPLDDSSNASASLYETTSHAVPVVLRVISSV